MNERYNRWEPSKFRMDCRKTEMMEDNIKGKFVAQRDGVKQGRKLNGSTCTLDAIKYIKQIEREQKREESAS